VHSPITPKDIRIHGKKFSHLTLPDYFKRTVLRQNLTGNKLHLLFFGYLSKNMLLCGIGEYAKNYIIMKFVLSWLFLAQAKKIKS
jgi:hypothetical protein